MQIQSSFKEELVFPNTDLVQSNHVKPWFMLCRIFLILFYFFNFYFSFCYPKLF